MISTQAAHILLVRFSRKLEIRTYNIDLKKGTSDKRTKCDKSRMIIILVAQSGKRKIAVRVMRAHVPNNPDTNFDDA